MRLTPAFTANKCWLMPIRSRSSRNRTPIFMLTIVDIDNDYMQNRAVNVCYQHCIYKEDHMKQKPLKSREDVLSDLSKKGLSIAELSRQIGYDRMTVYSVLHSDKPCRFGKSHKVAVSLGIKSGELV